VREREKVKLILDDAQAFATLLGRVDRVAQLAAAGRPLDSWERDRRRLEADRDTHEDEVVFDFLQSDRMQVVLVGDPEVIRREVTPLGLGAIEELRLVE
jgi:hypothetical protein